MTALELFLERFEEAGGEVLPDLDALFDPSFQGLNLSVEPALKRKLGKRLSEFFVESDVEEAEIALTRADAAAAETGSLIFACRSRKKHLYISLPRIHVAFLKKSRIYLSLDEALAPYMDFPYISIVTGPSKTGDIELIHVSGVHGPERVLLILED